MPSVATFRRELRLTPAAYKAVGYWIDGAEDWRARYDALDDDSRNAFEVLWDSDRSEAKIEEEYDERLIALGL